LRVSLDNIEGIEIRKCRRNPEKMMADSFAVVKKYLKMEIMQCMIPPLLKFINHKSKNISNINYRQIVYLA
jgi:hypothetical protein